MKLDRAIALERRAQNALADVISAARSFGQTSKRMEESKRERLAAIGIGAKAPRWLHSFCQGYWRALVDGVYRNDLVFGCIVDGVFYGTHSNRPDYYERHGFSPSIFSDKMDVNKGTVGHYWHGNKDRPFFISNPPAEQQAMDAGKARHETEPT